MYHSDLKIVVSGNYGIGDMRHNYADLTLINLKIEFEPKGDFTNGIKK